MDTKAYTALTTEPSKVGLAFATDYSGTSAPSGGAVAAWWDDLTDSQKVAVVDIDKDATDNDSDTCDHDDLCVSGAGEVGFGGGEEIRDYAMATAAGKLLITQAFHWNVLSGPEMYYAAVAGGLSSADNYKAPFAGLSDAEKASVEGLYTAGILRRGTGATLTADCGFWHDGRRR